MPCQRNVLDELVSVSVECFARCISVVYPNLVGLGEIDCFAWISSESSNRMNHLTRAQIHHFNRPLMLSRNEQALALYVHCHVVEVALNIRQWDALNLS